MDQGWRPPTRLFDLYEKGFRRSVVPYMFARDVTIDGASRLSGYADLSGTGGMRAYVFLDRDHPPTAWAVARGMLVSADRMGTVPNGYPVSFMLAGMVQSGNNVRLANEAALEAVRKARFRDRVSRIEGMYFFADIADAAKHIGDRNWPTYFDWANLVEVELYASAMTRLDANWITHAPLDRDNRINGEDGDWIDRYWAGEARDQNPTWELIAKGVAIVLDETVRRACYDLTRRAFPTAEIFLLMSRLAGEAGSAGGLVVPFIGRDSNGDVALHYLLNDEAFHNPEVIADIHRHPDSAYLGMLMNQQESWPLPDFRPWGKMLLSSGERA